MVFPFVLKQEGYLRDFCKAIMAIGFALKDVHVFAKSHVSTTWGTAHYHAFLVQGLPHVVFVVVHVLSNEEHRRSNIQPALHRRQGCVLL